MANRQYTSVLDLAFTTGQLAAEIIDWQINENEYSESDHEVIQFSVTTEDIELVDSPFNAPLNIQKANWAEFNQQLGQESQSMLTDLRQLETQDLNQEQMETIACSLRDLITKAAEQNIPRRKPCSRSKVWWNPNLTLLRKEIAKFLFPEIKAKFPEVQKPSYIDDVALCTTGRNAEENAKVLQEVAKTVFT
ncbi:Endonuclease/exonuclease/phosphatase [Lasallia pustulata]|uniref:Endonuclease/exonuclease/phosphatase n=1 Tax=Lasallia pustulata TaxID=136370 RepID=A0A1W5D2K1_9LECA|nr:Endonuclease/exonuclease/phosphatase [Lasallia pustulata]